MLREQGWFFDGKWLGWAWIGILLADQRAGRHGACGQAGDNWPKPGYLAIHRPIYTTILLRILFFLKKALAIR